MEAKLLPLQQSSPGSEKREASRKAENPGAWSVSRLFAFIQPQQCQVEGASPSNLFLGSLGLVCPVPTQTAHEKENVDKK